MALTFIDTNKLARRHTPQGDVTEILNHELAGANNVVGSLRWLDPGQTFEVPESDRHQLIYLMDGKGSIRLEGKDYEVSKGAGVYLGPSETATLQAAPGSSLAQGSSLKLFHLVVPRIPE